MTILIDEVYNLFTGPLDPRTVGWSLTNGWPLLYTTIAYLAFVLKIGPKYMEKRPAYDLKTFTTVYNVIQIIGCVYMLHGYIKYEALGWNVFSCTTLVYTFDEKPYGLAHVMWVYALFKLIEYTETIVFVLRKKQNQVSGLHVYHHVSTLFFAWVSLRFRAGGIGGFIQAANSFIHILMYAYYLISVHPVWQKRVAKFKKYLTTMQMIQFCLMLFNSTQAFYVDRCANYQGVVVMFAPNIILVFYLFKRFFDKSYKAKPRQQKTE